MNSKMITVSRGYCKQNKNVLRIYHLNRTGRGREREREREMRVRIRPLETRDDFKRYIDLMNELSHSIDIDRVDTEMMWRRFVNHLSDNHQVWVLEDEEECVVVGSGTILIEPKVLHNFGSAAHIEDVVVAGTHQNQGLGRQIIGHLIDVARRRGCYKVILDCRDELQSFYTRCGLTRRGIQMALYLDK